MPLDLSTPYARSLREDAARCEGNATFCRQWAKDHPSQRRVWIEQAKDWLARARAYNASAFKLPGGVQ